MGLTMHVSKQVVLAEGTVVCTIIYEQESDGYVLDTFTITEAGNSSVVGTTAAVTVAKNSDSAVPFNFVAVNTPIDIDSVGTLNTGDYITITYSVEADSGVGVGTNVTAAVTVTDGTTPASGSITAYGADEVRSNDTAAVQISGGSSYSLVIPSITSVLGDTVTITLTSDVSSAEISDTITYTATITNSGDGTITDCLFYSPLDSGITYTSGNLTVTNNSVNVTGSLTGAPTDTSTFNAGFNVVETAVTSTHVAAGTSTVVVFIVTLASTPSTNPILDTVTLTYDYELSDQQPPVEDVELRSDTDSVIFNAGLIVQKSVDKSYVEVDGTLTYSIAIVNNTGAVVLGENLLFTDTLPTNTTFIVNSFRENNTVLTSVVSGDFGTGITLTDPIEIGGVTILTFKVKVTSGE